MSVRAGGARQPARTPAANPHTCPCHDVPRLRDGSNPPNSPPKKNTAQDGGEDPLQSSGEERASDQVPEPAEDQPAGPDDEP